MEDTYAIQVTIDYIIFDLWGVKEPNCVMIVMATGGLPFAGNI